MQFVAAECIKILLLLSSSQRMPADSRQILVLNPKFWQNEAARGSSRDVVLAQPRELRAREPRRAVRAWPDAAYCPAERGPLVLAMLPAIDSEQMLRCGKADGAPGRNYLPQWGGQRWPDVLWGRGGGSGPAGLALATGCYEPLLESLL